MRSMQLLIYRADEQLLEVRARDFKTHWMTAVAVLDDDTYLGAENSYNLFTLRKNADAASDEDRNRLEVSQYQMCFYPCCASFRDCSATLHELTQVDVHLHPMQCVSPFKQHLLSVPLMHDRASHVSRSQPWHLLSSVHSWCSIVNLTVMSTAFMIAMACETH